MTLLYALIQRLIQSIVKGNAYLILTVLEFAMVVLEKMDVEYVKEITAHVLAVWIQMHAILWNQQFSMRH
jgi:hypothetical protein